MRWHETRVKVRFNEVDQWGMVWYANYFIYLEVARCEILEMFGLLPDSLWEMGYTAPIINASCQYKNPARFNDLLLIKTTLVPQQAAKLTFKFEISREDNNHLVMRAETTQVLLNKNGYMIYKLTGPIAEKINALTAYLAGTGYQEAVK